MEPALESAAQEQAQVIDAVVELRVGGVTHIRVACRRRNADSSFVTGQTLNVDGGAHMS